MISDIVATVRRLPTSAVVVLAATVASCLTLLWNVAAARADETVFACGSAPYQSAGVMQEFETFGTAATNTCAAPNGTNLEALTLRQDSVNPEKYGQTAGWFAYVPTGLGILRAQASQVSTQAVLGNGYVAQFVWGGGSTSGTSRIANNVTDVSFDTSPLTPGGMWSGDFGFVLACAPSQGGGCAVQYPFPPTVSVSGVELTVGESPGYQPGFANGSGLWSQSGWVRGNDWSLGFSSSSVAGICQESATLNGLGLPGAVDVSGSRNQMAWSQCAAPAYSAPSIDTKQFGQGGMPLTLNATDAVGVSNADTKTVYVDNSQPTVLLSGPRTAASTAGTQYVQASAGGSPSGIAEIQCSADGGPATSYTAATAQVPVSGIGNHVVSCAAENNAVDAAGAHGWSASPVTFSLDIGAPTVSGLSFTKVLHALKCRPVKQRVAIPARWVTVRRHGKLVKLHRRAHAKVEKVMKCHMRMVKRKVTVLVKRKRHGKTVLVKRKKVERVPLPPQIVAKSTKRVPFGKGVTVSGFLVTAQDVALPGRTIDVLTAPDNQLAQWSQAAVVTTDGNGAWAAQLPAGPSRFVEAAYAGDSTTLPSTSAAATLLVPAHIGITVTPRRLPWSGAVTFRGHLSGGYVPPDGVPLYLEIDTARHHRPYTPVPLRTNSKGTFSFKFSWHSGGGVAAYPMRVALLGTGSDYPFVASSSRAVTVTFGRATPKAGRKHLHHKHRKRGRKKR